MRWIAFIPAALLASVAAHYAGLVMFFGGALVAFMDMEKVATYWMYVSPLFRGLAAVLGGAFVAPSHEKAVACFLFIGHALTFTFAAVMLAYVIGQQSVVVSGSGSFCEKA